MNSWIYPAVIHFQRESINFYIEEGDFNPSAKHTVQQNMKLNIWPFSDDLFSCSHCISGQQLVHDSSCEWCIPIFATIGHMWGFWPSCTQTDGYAYNIFLVCDIATAHWVVSPALLKTHKDGQRASKHIWNRMLASLWLAAFEIESHNFIALFDSLWHANQHKAGIQNIKQPLPNVKLFQQNIVFFQSNCCRKKQKKLQIWHRIFQAASNNTEVSYRAKVQILSNISRPTTPCPARPHLLNNTGNSSQGSSPLLLPSPSLDKPMPRGREERENREMEPHNIHWQREAYLHDAVGKGKRELDNIIFRGFAPTSMYINIYLCFWIESIQVTKLEILVFVHYFSIYNFKDQSNTKITFDMDIIIIQTEN